MTYLYSLPYTPDSAELFAKIAELPGAAFLDSGHPYADKGRYDILTACPFMTLTTQGAITEIITLEKTRLSADDPFLLLKNVLVEISGAKATESDLPFTGGAIGYFSYDLARRLEHLPNKSTNDLNLPEMVIGIYDWAMVVDHQKQCISLVNAGVCENTAAICAHILHLLQKNIACKLNPTVRLLSPLQSNFSEITYAQAFDRVQKHLYEGDCYQVNLAQRFSAQISGPSWELYQALRRKNPAEFGAFLQTSNANILSLSPERFLSVKNKKVITMPIKGTLPRGKTRKEDEQLKEKLLHSEKDRAENLMIVDLMRNDLSKNCRAGSVKVPHLFSLETLPAVHHLVSTITAEITENKHSLDLLRDCFPGGSVTGAPKLRAMEIIDTLEPHRRAVYCGAIGYINFNGNMDLNIAIRTLLHQKDQLYCYAGGALTIDSQLKSEYAETFYKVSVIFNVIKNL